MNPNNTYWTTRDKRRLLIANMDIDHVNFCIKMLIDKYGHDGVCSEYYCPRQRLVNLILRQEQEIPLIALTDPNQ